MTLTEISARMIELVEQKGWIRSSSSRPQTARNLAISVSLEAAELLEHFQWRDDPADLAEVGDEMADVVLYVVRLASVLGVDLEAAIQSKLEKNSARTWPDYVGRHDG